MNLLERIRFNKDLDEKEKKQKKNDEIKKFDNLSYDELVIEYAKEKSTLVVYKSIILTFFVSGTFLILGGFWQFAIKFFMFLFSQKTDFANNIEKNVYIATWCLIVLFFTAVVLVGLYYVFKKFRAVNQKFITIEKILEKKKTKE